MCEFFSCIATRDGRLLFTEENSHETIITRANLRDTDRHLRHWVRVEVTPRGDGWGPVKVDEAETPAWWDADRAAIEARVVALAERVRPARAAYHAAEREARAAYDAAMREAGAAYNAAMREAGAAYNAAMREARAAYHAAMREPRAAYDAAMREPRAAYDAALRQLPGYVAANGRQTKCSASGSGAGGFS